MPFICGPLIFIAETTSGGGGATGGALDATGAVDAAAVVDCVADGVGALVTDADGVVFVFDSASPPPHANAKTPDAASAATTNHFVAFFMASDLSDEVGARLAPCAGNQPERLAFAFAAARLDARARPSSRCTRATRSTCPFAGKRS